MARQANASLSGVGIWNQFRLAMSRLLGAPPSEMGWEGAPSASPTQLIQAAFDSLFRELSPESIQLLIEEFDSGRLFLWHSEPKGLPLSVACKEFAGARDHSTAHAYLQFLPGGDWILEPGNSKNPLVKFNLDGKRQSIRTAIPEALFAAFAPHERVVSIRMDLGEEWQGRFLICDPSRSASNRSIHKTLRRFSKEAAGPIHRAQYGLRACREAAAEERSRLARELHDGAIQSILGAELQLESLKHRLGAMPDAQRSVVEVQNILRREAAELRRLVNDTREKALGPERLLKFLSGLLERFQRDTGIVTRFFADIHKDPMPPRICHEIARIAEEGVTNARKHSKASTLTVRVGSAGNYWLLVIVDDGVGFDFRGAWSLERLVATELGPRVIKERVQALNGNLRIESTPSGARIEISIPKSGMSMNPFHQTNTIKPRHHESYSSSNR